MQLSLQTLAQYRSIHPDAQFLFFWGHRPQKDGSVGKGCFSQWWPCSFRSEGKTFSSAEQYMMYQKAILFEDQDIAGQIYRASDPKQIKDMGRKVRGFDAATWDAEKYDIVLKANLLKFEQDPNLKAFLLSTGKAILVEASPYDQIWGIGMKEGDPGIEDPANWKGENLLGFALMETRELLQL